MPPKPSKEKPKIPTITWTLTLVWKLIDMAQSDQNRNVIIGKVKEDAHHILCLLKAVASCAEPIKPCE